MLYGRIAAIEGRPDKIEKGVSRFRDVALPLVEQAEGFAGALMLIDRENGRALGITLWDSIAHRDATDAALAAIRTGAADAMGAETAEVQLYEVPIFITKEEG